MCDTHAYLVRDGKEELVLENVDYFEAESGTIRLFNIFGEQKVVRGAVKQFSLRDHKIVVAE